MTKAEKKIAYTALGSAIGSVAGFAFGLAKMPTEIAFGLTSPVSYPVIGAVSAAVHKPFGKDTAANVIAGGAIGACLVPFTPVILACTPLNPFVWGLSGAAIGGLCGYQEAKKDK